MSQLLPLSRFVLIVCFVLLTVIDLPAQSRWIFVGTSSDDASWYIDKTLTEKISGTITAWEKVILIDGSYSIRLTEWNCSERVKRLVQSQDYTPSGEVLRIQEAPIPWRAVVPDAIEEGFFNVVCSVSKKKIAERNDNLSSPRSFAQIIKKSNLMSEASPRGEVIRKVIVGEKLILVSEQSTGVWYRVLDPQTNSEGWLNGNHFKIVKAAKTPEKRKLVGKRNLN